MTRVAGVDLGYSGQKYTWKNKQDGHAIIKERLDRVVVSVDWLEIFQEAQV